MNWRKGVVWDIHTHTSEYSNCSRQSIDEVIEQAHTIGLHGICITDHNATNIKADLAERRETLPLTVVVGVELWTDLGDILGFGLTAEYEYRGEYWQVPFEKAVGDNPGAVWVVAHPFRTGFAVKRDIIERRYSVVISAIEGFNANCKQEENLKSCSWAAALGKPVTGGSDSHSIDRIGTNVTLFDRPVLSEAEFLDALKMGCFTPGERRKRGGFRKLNHYKVL